MINICLSYLASTLWKLALPPIIAIFLAKFAEIQASLSTDNNHNDGPANAKNIVDEAIYREMP